MFFGDKPFSRIRTRTTASKRSRLSDLLVLCARMGFNP